MKILNKLKVIVLLSSLFLLHDASAQKLWESKYIKLKSDGKLAYRPDEQGNIIPDFSRVGYQQGQKTIPNAPVMDTLYATGNDDQQKIQKAIDELSKIPVDKNGIRGAILLKKGVYKIPGSIKITANGIVLRGEGEETVLLATGKGQRKTIIASGNGKLEEVPNTRIKITDNYVPVGAKYFNVANTKGLKVGDKIVVFRPGTANWIKDLKMDQIEDKPTLVQWKADDYHLEFERVITAIKGNRIDIDNPIVMAMETQYGGGEVYRYTFEGRINEVGIENLALESEYNGDTDEDHGWDAISYNRIENSWVSGVTSKYFGYSCVNLGNFSKQITVKDCKSLSPKSQIIGGRRYSFNNDGQLNLVMNCYAAEGRHDYVTGAKVAGPNVFYNCRSENAKADIGPHHRWAVGTLYDNVVTDGEINIQDRGNWGTGHGWSGANQVLWNCTASKVAIQNPYVSGKNYAFSLNANLYDGRLKGRPVGIVEGLNKKGLMPLSLYLKQVEELKKK
ncbi:hypothetical protein [Pedobacter cryotolerans]|uniref:Pectate lyase superfamily protein domain-containing protein n=1 Tax=Pedobacter cryotolerans TaxID=2571270 RepID=A0A4U1C941_9SPHI|nr:hypothetical protein [Pedobacter cryotolerans]TKC02308.1 hypothetical protein FA045_03220 [Pedobacter cryotolerans]